ncbi:VOC family protein [Streptomyces dysideae]|uniref:VOC domain-containing protein n=1 Tax=Streptomyces dysideae TaxID=909626 RepID=A0A124IEM6_9ACTN|nr:VOC family protein [Streptomyces dysideae]KUO18767.1 hypothetical protein AQJ91_23100 [Streptomyces dysideae]
MIIGLDHVGLATADPAGAGSLLALLGLSLEDQGTAADYGVECEFWTPAKGGPTVELVSPRDDDTAVNGRLARKEQGLYHVAFEVDHLEGELDRLGREGFVLVDQEPRAGARSGMRVAFLYARRPAGLLIELVEYRRPDVPS